MNGCCSHLMVVFRTDEPRPGLHTNSRWECTECNSRFTPYTDSAKCGHGLNFQIGDERGNFTCTVCRMNLAETRNKLATEILSRSSGKSA